MCMLKRCNWYCKVAACLCIVFVCTMCKGLMVCLCTVICSPNMSTMGVPIPIVCLATVDTKGVMQCQQLLDTASATSSLVEHASAELFMEVDEPSCSPSPHGRATRPLFSHPLQVSNFPRLSCLGAAYHFAGHLRALHVDLAGPAT